ncbi:MAG: hypothetical protein GX442_06820 [Candidatus Riflebacteria bacterium]|nr:hypothetical protein [Candidatus Riflebacteria bacterium]
MPLWDEDRIPFTQEKFAAALERCRTGGVSTGLRSLLETLHQDRMPWRELRPVLDRFLEDLARGDPRRRNELFDLGLQEMRTLARQALGEAGDALDRLVGPEPRPHAAQKVAIARLTWFLAISSPDFRLAHEGDDRWAILERYGDGYEFHGLVIVKMPAPTAGAWTWGVVRQRETRLWEDF